MSLMGFKACAIRSFTTTTVSCFKFGRYNLQSEDGGYMKRKLAQLAEESRPFKDDPKAGKIYFEGEELEPAGPITISEANKELLEKMAKEIEGKEFDYSNQRAISIATKIPSYAPKESRDIAISKPWTGTESPLETSSRMLNDSFKPLKVNKQPAVSMPKLSPKISISHRLATAREKSLDYELHHKHSQKKSSLDEEDESGPSFRELYQERFSGVSMMANSLSAIDSMASQRIEDAIARGEFKNIPRGHKVEQDPHLSNAYIDTTEYFLNRIIKDQGGAPVWIDKQGGLKGQIENFRKELVESFLNHAIMVLDNKNKGCSVEEALNRVRVHADKILQNVDSYSDSEWESKHEKYHKTFVDSLNSAIRSYNLQAPSVSRWGYIILEKELKLCYKMAAPKLVKAMENFLIPPISNPKVEFTTKDGKMIPGPKKADEPVFSMVDKELLYEEKADGITDMFKQLFKTKLF